MGPKYMRAAAKFARFSCKYTYAVFTPCKKFMKKIMKYDLQRGFDTQKIKLWINEVAHHSRPDQDDPIIR